MTHFLIVPIGPPACGKSTLRHWLLDNGFDPDGIVSADDYRRILTGEQGNQLVNAEAFSIVNTVVRTRLQNWLNVYLDATNLRPSDWDQAVDGAFAANAHPVFVLFDTPADECLKRNRLRRDPVPEGVMDRLLGVHQQITRAAIGEKVGFDVPVYGQEQFMDYRWEFLNV